MIIKTARTLLIAVVATFALAASVQAVTQGNIFNPANLIVLGTCAGSGGGGSC